MCPLFSYEYLVEFWKNEYKGEAMVDNTTDKNLNEQNDETEKNNNFIEVKVDGECDRLYFPLEGIQKCGCGVIFEKIIKSKDRLKEAIKYSNIHNKVSENTLCKKIVKFVEISKEGFLVDGNLVNLMEHIIEGNNDMSIKIDSDKLKIKNVGSSVKYIPPPEKIDYLPLYHEYVNSLIDIYKVKTIKANSIGIEEVWTWENFYNRKGESTIHSMLLQKDSMLTKNDFVAIMDYLKARTRVERNEIVPKRDCVNLLNGILEFSHGKVVFTPRNKMSDFSDCNFIDILPVKYDPGARSLEIDRIIGEILKPDEVELFYEIVAYAFINDSRFKKAFILAGKPNTGKTTLLNIIVNLFGEYNISSVSLYQMDPSKNTFAGADLDGVRLNIVDEMPNITVKNVEIFKNASGGAVGFRVEKKHKDGYNIKPYAKHIFTANELPTVEDEISESFFSRIIIIILEHVFEAKSDGDLDSLKDKKFSEIEKSGLLNHVIQALERLLRSREFTYDSDPEEIWNEYRIKYNQNSLRHFVDTVINKDSHIGWIRKEFLYQYYRLFCDSKGIIPLNKNLFGRNMKKLGIKECYPEAGEKQCYAWSGISLKENYFVPYFETKYPNKDFHWQSNEEYKVMVTYECNSCRNETYHSGNFSGVDNSYILKFVCKCGNDKFSVINVHWKGSDFTKNEFEEYRKNKDKIILGHNEVMTVEEFDNFVNKKENIKNILYRIDDELRGVEIGK